MTLIGILVEPAFGETENSGACTGVTTRTEYVPAAQRVVLTLVSLNSVGEDPTLHAGESAELSTFGSVFRSTTYEPAGASVNTFGGSITSTVASSGPGVGVTSSFRFKMRRAGATLDSIVTVSGTHDSTCSVTGDGPSHAACVL
jgi:hypothetical protein